MGDVDFKMFIRVGFTGVAVQCEGSHWREGGVGGWGDGMVNKSGKGGGEVVRGMWVAGR